MIKVKTDHGSKSRRIGLENKNRVETWFLKNPDRTIADCSRALGLTWQTVKKHVVAIQKEESMQ